MSSVSQSQKMGYLFGLLLLPIFIVFAYMGQPERGFILMCLAGVFVTAGYVRRRDIGDPRIIAILVALFLIEAAAVFSVNIPREHFPGIILLPVAIANVAIVMALIRIAESFFKPDSD